MTKIIREILRLLWRVVREVFWKWLKPIVTKIVLLSAVIVAAITLLAMLVMGSC